MTRLQPVLFWLLFLVPPAAAAQDDYYPARTGPPKNAPAKPRHTIVLRDGTELRGELIRDDSTGTVIRTRNLGEVQLRPDQILRIEQESVRGEEATYPNLFSQTMRVAPTAFSAERGRLYYRNYYVYLNQFEYGITDNWSVGAAVYPSIFINGVSLTTKVSLPVSDRVRVGIQAQYAGLRFILGDGEGIGYVQGLVTTGDRQNNTTYGLGWSISGGGLSRNVVGTFGVVRKVGPKLTFISENFALFGSGINRSLDFAGVLSGGVRFDRRRHAFDVALYVPLLISSRIRPIFTVVPFGSYHLRIGK